MSRNLVGVVGPTIIKAEVDAVLPKTETEVGVFKAERRRRKSRNALVSASLYPAAWFLLVFSFAKPVRMRAVRSMSWEMVAHP